MYFPLIFDDQRPIQAIWYPGEDANGYSTNQKVVEVSRCDKIVAYRENGPLDHIPFFAVYRGDEIIARVPAYMVEVRYAIGGAA